MFNPIITKKTLSPGTVVFLHYLQLAILELATIGINVTKNEIPNSSLKYSRNVAIY